MEIPTRQAVMAGIRKQGGRIAAVLPVHYPRALLRAHGFYPIEVWGPPHVDDMDGTRHFPEYTCKIVQKACRFLTGPGAGRADLILLPHTCDSLQGMASVMADFIRPDLPLLTLYHARGRRPSDLEFMTAELMHLSDELGVVSGRTPSNAELTAAMDLEDEAIQLFAEIAWNRNRYDLTDREFYAFLRAREFLPAEAFLALAKTLPKGRPDLHGPGILLSGIVAEPMEIFNHINDFGAHVIADDLACCSRRIYDIGGPAGAAPFERMARQLMSMPPDPTVSTPYTQRFAFLTERMQAGRARAMVVLNPKFCEPELFYLPMLEQAVKQAGFGFLYLETELTPTLPHTLLNRLNAFIEVIS